MRLTDADKLIEKLRDFKEWENDDGSPIHTMSEIQRIDRCINFAQAELTAYDVDKVVEQLKEEAEHSYTDYEAYAEERGLDVEDDWHYCGLKRAIEIVKAGGIDEQ